MCLELEVEINLNTLRSRVHPRDLILGAQRKAPIAVIGFTAQSSSVRCLASSDFASVARKNYVILLDLLLI
jgi:hypothetical protein